LTKEQEEKLSKFVFNNFIPDSKIAIKWIKENFDITYSHNGINKILKRLGFVYKKPRKVPGKHPDEQTQRAFIQKIEGTIQSCKNSNKEAVYFMDGSGFYHNTNPSCGWIKKGKDKLFKTNTSEKINVNGTYNPKDQETICIEQQKPVNQQSNIKLIDKITALHPEHKTIHIVLDNARYNYGNIFIEHIQKLENDKNIKIDLIYIPPYSPNLNLIERLWKYAKKTLLSFYYEKFTQFTENIIDFFERRIRERSHKAVLKHFIGEKFHIIEG